MQHAPRDYSLLHQIDYLETPPSYAAFLEHYLEPNIPVLIGPALTEAWRARRQWVCPDTGKPNFATLREQLCQTPVQVPVADCLTRDYTDQKRSAMDLREFLDEWEASSNADQSSRTYLKDFHFVKTFPDYDAYQTPEIFCDDWMNEFWTRREDMDDDYRFMYCGGDGTFTPFHADVYRSYSWSANICGVKKWTLFPPDQEHLFQDNLHNTVYNINHVDRTQFPNFDKSKSFSLYQNPGQTLFVPSGWWHQVENIGDTISINHNWCNGSNLDLLLDSLASDLKEVERELAHLKDMMDDHEWIETCQKVLLSNSGWDWSTLWNMCSTVRERVKRQMEQGDHHVIQESPPLLRIEASTENRKPRETPIFPPPMISQQPPLELTLKRVDAVLDFIRQDPSAAWFLTHTRGILVE
ncbi:JmjC domain-containing protein 4 [Mortierella alpina]|nr:JmjC domain-containing protein 4 [Mortierella alpina]